MVNSLFIANMVQQEYFDKLETLNLNKCDSLASEDIILIIQQIGEDFDIESLIEEEFLPGGNTSLVTNEVIKAISRSKPFKKKFIQDNLEDEDERTYFNFNIRMFRLVDYGINYLIEENVARLTDYDDYIMHYSSFLTFESLQIILKLANSGNKEILLQLKNVSKFDLSQNKFIFNQRKKDRIYDALDHFQSKYHFV